MVLKIRSPRITLGIMQWTGMYRGYDGFVSRSGLSVTARRDMDRFP